MVSWIKQLMMRGGRLPAGQRSDATSLAHLAANELRDVTLHSDIACEPAMGIQHWGDAEQVPEGAA